MHLTRIVFQSFSDFNYLGDRINQNHRLFSRYRDPCADGPGKDKPWAVGTEWR